MAILVASKVRLFVHQERDEEVLRFLQKRGDIEIVSSDEERGAISHSAEYARAKLDFAIRFLSPYASKKKGMRNFFLGERIEKTPEEIADVLQNFNWEQLSDAAAKLEGEQNDLSKALKEIEEENLLLEQWKDVRFDALASQRFGVLLGKMSSKDGDAFEQKAKEQTKYLEIMRFRDSDEVCFFWCIAEKKVLEAIRSLLLSFGGVEFPFDVSVVPEKRILELQEKRKDLLSAQNELCEKLRTLAQNLDSLKVCYDAFSSDEVLAKSRRNAFLVGHVVVYDAWVLEKNIQELKNDLNNAFPVSFLEKIEIKEGEKAPVCIKNSPLIEPVVNITKMYGMPNASEIDPTPYLAPFWILFFGFCLTDAGYGLLLTLATGLALGLRLPFEKEMRSMILLFFYAGISTFVMGVLFGGWFGLTVDQVPSFLTYTNSTGQHLFLGQIFSPLEDLMSKVIPFTLVLAFLHLATGTILSGAVAWKRGDRQKIFFVSIPLILLLIFGGAMIMFPSVKIVSIFSFALLLIVVWGMGSGVKNLFLRPFIGLLKLFVELFGWFSNLLSYARLFALGLATGIIAMAFNLVAQTIGGMLPVLINVLVMIIIILFGHILNIGINFLGAYVHSSRLQFVEFFGLFLEGGGREFYPLQRKHRYLFFTNG
jgi:V/A-type H+/Na+-transporting ATPase subunit I